MSRLARHPWHLAIGALAAGLAFSAAPRAATVVALAAGCLTGLGTRRPVLAVLAAVLVLGGVAAGQARRAALDRPGERLRRDARVHGEAVALERARAGPFGWSLELELGRGPARGARLLGRLPRGLSSVARADPGAIVSLTGSAAPLRGHGGYQAYLRNRGVAGELDVEEARLTGRRRGGSRGLVDRLRLRGERGVAAGLPSAEAALLRGMVLGEDEAIGKAVRTDWRRAGLAHLLSEACPARRNRKRPRPVVDPR